MEKISGVVITFNEERNIERCIKSLLPAVDEIIVVDSFSTDNTENICSQFEMIRFYKRKFDNYSSQKNSAIEKLSYSKVLSLDADEVISEELLQSILFAKNNWKYDGYYCHRLNNYCGKWIKYGEWYPDSKLRLWDIRKGAWDDKNVHEKVKLVSGARIGTLKGDLHHYSYTSISEHITQLNKYTELAVAQAFRKKKTVSVLEIVIRPIWRFFSGFIIKRGICDGYYGFVISTISSFTTFLKYCKLHELNKSQK